VAKEEPTLSQYFSVLEEGVSKFILKRLKADLRFNYYYVCLLFVCVFVVVVVVVVVFCCLL
jgi:hypothetical protein